LANRRQISYEYLVECAQLARQGIEAWRRLPPCERLLTALVLDQPRWLEKFDGTLGIVLSLTPNKWLRAAGLISISLKQATLSIETDAPTPLVATEPQTRSTASDRALLRLKDVIELTGLSRSTIYHLEARGKFCGRVQITPRRVAWRTEDVYAWIRSRTPKV